MAPARNVSGKPGFFALRAAALAALNEGQRFFCLLTLCLEKTGTLPPAANTIFYHLLTQAGFRDFLLPLRLKVTGGARLTPDCLQTLHARSSSGQATAGTPARYAISSRALKPPAAR